MSWILTRHGHKFDPLNPDPRTFDIRDIAHALANICRFTGHTQSFYSVAEHSWRMSFIVPPEHAFTALMHDATEAYLADIARPVKPHLVNYQDIEAGLWLALTKVYPLPAKLPLIVEQADLIMLATEKRDLMPSHVEPWPVLAGVTPLQEVIIPMPPPAARRRFLDRVHELTGVSGKVVGRLA